MKTIAKGRIFSVTSEVSDEHLKMLRKAPEFVREVYESAALDWHANTLPKHFERSAHGRYGYVERTKGYLKTKGSSPDLQSPVKSGHSGAMKAELTGKAQVRKLGVAGVSLKMTARALNFAGSDAVTSLALKVKNSAGNMYPNMHREIREVTAEEEQGIRTLCETRLAVIYQRAL